MPSEGTFAWYFFMNHSISVADANGESLPLSECRDPTGPSFTVFFSPHPAKVEFVVLVECPFEADPKGRAQ
jgi:hypothetical protein